MKPIPAIMQAVVDVDIVAERIIVKLNEERSAEAKIVKLQGQLDKLQRQLEGELGAKRKRRIEIGQLLNEVRPTWPERGRNAKGWSEFLKRVQLDDSTAWRYMDEARSGDVFSQKIHPNQPDSFNSDKSDLGVRENAEDEAGGDRRPIAADRVGMDSSAADSPDVPIGSQARQLAERDADDGAELPPPDESTPKPANVLGGSGDPERGTYCTPRHIAEAVGAWDLDPFSNPRSHITASEHCQLERGDDGLLDLAQPGTYYIHGQGQGQAAHGTRVWIQPPYDVVLDAIAHYGHTRFCALLRFDTSTEWFRQLLPLTSVICFPLERLEFDAPPGLETGPIPYPHALYYASEDDVTDEVRSMCFVARIDYRPAQEG